MTATPNLPTAPSAASILGALTQPRILDLARLFGVRLRTGNSTPKHKLASLLGAQLRVPSLLRELGRARPNRTTRPGVGPRDRRPGRPAEPEAGPAHAPTQFRGPAAVLSAAPRG